MIINDWKPEVGSLLRRLEKAGFEIVSGDNGEYEFRLLPAHSSKFVEDLIACDEARLYVRLGSVNFWLYLVLGNSPGELVSDYSVPAAATTGQNSVLNSVVDGHYAYWQTRTQPVKEVE